MTVKNFISMISIFLIVSWFVFVAPPSQGKDGQVCSEVLSYAGKSYGSENDPAYMSYDKALRACVAERIKKEFGVALDPTKYSGFDLLEIESLLKFKKAEERVEDLLKGFLNRR